MRFKYYVNSNIPQAAWCAVIQTGQDVVDVELGLAVPHNEKFFVAGVWDGEFLEGGFAEASFSCCSGARIGIYKDGCKSKDYPLHEIEGVTFSTSSTYLGAVFGVIVEEKIYLSNSLAFVLERSESQLLNDYLDYQKDMCSAIFWK